MSLVKKTMNFGDRLIGETQPVFIIAEIGVNHNGSVKIAKQLIDSAKSAGVDCVKFQTFFTDEIISKDAPLAKYQRNSTSGTTQKELVKNLELPPNSFNELKKYAEDLGLSFLSTPFDNKSVELLSDLDVEAFKISSGDLNNKQLLEKIASMHKPIILSTGMADLQEIREAVTWITEGGCDSYSILQCTSSYPTQIEDSNLSTIPIFKKEFGVPIGFSDHTVGSTASLVAVGLGAKIIEKHITLDKKMDGPDQSLSLEPDELKSFVSDIRMAEKSLGDGNKKCMTCEEDVKRVARKSLTAARNISKGKVIDKGDLSVKRPGMGIEPKYLDSILGKRVKKDIGIDELIEWADLE